MSYIEGETLQELLKQNRYAEAIQCCDHVITDLCYYSNIKRILDEEKNSVLYKTYVNKTKRVIEKLKANDKVSNLILSDNITVNNKIYKNVKNIIDCLYIDEKKK